MRHLKRDRDGFDMEFKTMVLLTAIIIIFAPVAFVLLMNPTPNPSGTLNSSGISYVIYQSGGTVYAQNGGSGTVDYSSADAGSVINSAITAIGITGGEIYIRSGQYSLTSMIKVYDNPNASYNNITIDSSGATLICDYPVAPTANIAVAGAFYNNAVISIADSSDITISNLKIDLNHVPGVSGICSSRISYWPGMNYVMNTKISNCEIYNGEKLTAALYYNGYGIWLNSNMNSVVENCYVHDCFVGIAMCGDYDHEGNYTGNTITKNTVKDCTSLGIYEFGDPGCSIINNMVSGSYDNNSDAFGAAGIWVGEGHPGDYRQIISENRVADCLHGIDVGGGAKEAMVTNNYITDCDGWGFAGTWNMVCTGNYICNNGKDTSLTGGERAGIWFGPGAPFHDDLITGNIIGNSVTPATQLYGAYDERSSAYSRIYANNLFVGSMVADVVMPTPNPAGNPNSVVRYNFGLGHATEAYGTSVIVAGSSSIIAYHGLEAAPTQILVTGSNNYSASCWVTNINSTCFTIHIPAVSPVDSCYMCWEAVYRPVLTGP